MMRTDPTVDTSRTAAAAAVRFGRPQETIEHVRTGTNSLYRCGDLAIRVAPHGYDETSLAEQLALVQHLTDRGFPTPAQVGGIEHIDGRAVTAWEWVEPNRPIEAYAVGRLARDFHNATRDYDGPVPEWDPLARARERLATAALTGRDEAVMHHQMEQLSAAAGATEVAPMGVVHGDLHDGNVIANDRGLFLLDFERFSRGPLEWEAAQRAASSQFFPSTRDGEWSAFLRGYGPLHLSETFETLVAVRAFVMTTWLLSLPITNTIEQEREVRLAYWRARDRGEPLGHPGWSPI